METFKKIYKDYGSPILFAYILLLSKTLGDFFVNKGLCTVDNEICKNGFGLLALTGAMIIIGFFTDLINRIIGNNILKLTVNDPKIIIDNENFEDENKMGILLYASINIENKLNEEISECYATLESIEPIFQDNKWIPKEELQVLNQLMKFSPRILRWRNNNPEKGKYKITIPPKSKKEFLRVGQLFIGVSKTNGKSVKSPEFSFSSVENPENINQFGLYKIKIRIDGKIKNGSENISPVFFDGYIYSDIIDESHKVSKNAKLESYPLLLSKGNPMKNNSLVNLIKSKSGLA